LHNAVLGSNEAPPHPRIMSLWAQWCAPCLEELVEWGDAGAAMKQAGLEVVSLCVDQSFKDLAKAVAVWASRVAPRDASHLLVPRAALPSEVDAVTALLAHIRGDGKLSLPTSFLVDRQGFVQVVYVGKVAAAQLLADVERYATTPLPDSVRSAFSGRWYFQAPRNLPELIGALQEAGLSEDASFYRRLLPRRRGR